MDKYSSGNVLHHNNFLDNNQGGVQASDNSTENRWNVTGSGNYWSDWTGPDEDLDGIVDNVYRIDGTAKAVDPFPLVNPSGIPVPLADAGEDIKIDQHETVFFDSSGCGGSPFIVNYTWSFTYGGEPTYLYGPDPSFKFEESGDYLVTLSVLNSQGKGTNDTMTVKVRDITPPTADIGGNITVNQYENYTFNAANCSDNEAIVDHTWVFVYDKYPRMLSGPTPSFTFYLAGEFSLTLTVTDEEGNEDEDTAVITVLDIDPPVAYAGRDLSVDQGDPAIFSGHLSTDNVGIAHFEWSFRYDNSDIVLSGISANFTFELPGHFPVALTVFDAVGNSDTDVVNVTVRDVTAPHVDPGDDIVVEANNTVRFNGSGSKDEVGIANWTWKFEYGGRDMELYGPEPEFRFNGSGEYKVYLYLTDEAGNSAWDHLTVTVNETEAGLENGTPTEEDDDEPDTAPDEEENGEEHISVYSRWAAVLGVIVVIAVAIFAYKRLGKEDESEPDLSGRTGEALGFLEKLMKSQDDGSKDEEQKDDLYEK